MKTEIRHFHGSISHLDHLSDWKILCDGHDDARCTGGDYYYKGDKDQAIELFKARQKVVRKLSDSYYSQPWV